MFNSSNFDERKIKEWVAKKNEERQLLKQKQNNFNKNVAQIKSEINDSLIKESLKKYFVNERGFTKEEFEKAYSERDQISSQPLPRNRRYPANERMEKFKDWLIAHKYSTNVANGYACAVNRIGKHQHEQGSKIDIWEASKESIRNLVRDYDTYGKYAKFGEKGHRTNINALIQYEKFL